MKLKAKFLLAIVLLVFLSTGSQAITFIDETFSLDGYGSFMDYPPRWTGDIVGGTLAPGTFWLELDDSGWPLDNAGTTENERWDYIFNNYFDYDDTPGAEGWDAYFPNTTLGDYQPEWRFFTAAGDTLGGLCTKFIVTVRDYNGNGIMEDSEYANKVISATLVAWINFSSGCFETFCGQGNMAGDMILADEMTWEEQLYVPSPEYATGILHLRDGSCSTDTDDSSWGKIKSIYNR